MRVWSRFCRIASSRSAGWFRLARRCPSLGLVGTEGPGTRSRSFAGRAFPSRSLGTRTTKTSSRTCRKTLEVVSRSRGFRNTVVWGSGIMERFRASGFGSDATIRSQSRALISVALPFGFRSGWPCLLTPVPCLSVRRITARLGVDRWLARATRRVFGFMQNRASIFRINLMSFPMLRGISPCPCFWLEAGSGGHPPEETVLGRHALRSRPCDAPPVRDALPLAATF